MTHRGYERDGARERGSEEGKEGGAYVRVAFDLQRQMREKTSSQSTTDGGIGDKYPLTPGDDRHSITQPTNYSPTHPLTHSLTQSLTHSLDQSLTQSINHSLTHTHTHTPTHTHS